MAVSDSLKYFAWFITVMASAFLTYRFFAAFREAVSLSDAILLVNVGIIFMLWFLAFTAKSGFVEANVKLIVFIPLFTLYVSDMYLAMQYGTKAVGNFMMYMFSSAIMIAASYQFSRYEQKLKEKESEQSSEPRV